MASKRSSAFSGAAAVRKDQSSDAENQSAGDGISSVYDACARPAGPFPADGHDAVIFQDPISRPVRRGLINGGF